MSHALLRMSSALSVIIQSYEPPPADILGSKEVDGRLLVVQHRKPTDLQHVKDAVAYIVQPAVAPLASGGLASRELITAELHSHLSVLRTNPSAIVIFAPTLLPESESAEVGLEIQARLRDFAHLLLGNEGALEVAELIKLVEEVWDTNGKLVVTNRLRSGGGATIALTVRYQSVA